MSEATSVTTSERPPKVTARSSLRNCWNFNSTHFIGLAQITLGVTVTISEVLAIIYFFNAEADYKLEIVGMVVGFLALCCGFCIFQANPLRPARSQQMFFIAALITGIISSLAVGGVLVLSMLNAHALFLYLSIHADNKDEKERYFHASMHHLAILRAFTATIYFLLLLALLLSLIRSCCSIFENKPPTNDVEGEYRPIVNREIPLRRGDSRAVTIGQT